VRGVVKKSWGRRILASLAIAFVATVAVVAPKFGVMGSLVACGLGGVIGFFIFLARRGKILPGSLSKDEEMALEKGRKDGVTELMIVAASGNVARMNDLLNYGATVDGVTKSGLTPLMYASANDQAETYNALLKHGANANAKSKRGLTAIEIAEEKGYSSFRKN
jgi:hypothetical protein